MFVFVCRDTRVGTQLATAHLAYKLQAQIKVFFESRPKALLRVQNTVLYAIAFARIFSKRGMLAVHVTLVTAWTTVFHLGHSEALVRGERLHKSFFRSNSRCSS